MPRPGYARITAARELAMPGVGTEPERRVRAEPMEQRQQLAQTVHRRHRGVGIRQSHVHVQRALRRALDQPAHLPLHALVALGLDQLHVEQPGIGMEAHCHQRRAGGGCGRASLGELADRLAHRAGGVRAHLELRQEGLVVDPLPREPGAREHLVGDVGQRERVRVDQQELLLQPDRERFAGTEAVRRRRPAGAGESAHGLSPSAARAAMRPNTSAAASPLA